MFVPQSCLRLVSVLHEIDIVEIHRLKPLKLQRLGSISCFIKSNQRSGDWMKKKSFVFHNSLNKRDLMLLDS